MVWIECHDAVFFIRLSENVVALSMWGWHFSTSGVLCEDLPVRASNLKSTITFLAFVS